MNQSFASKLFILDDFSVIFSIIYIRWLDQTHKCRVNIGLKYFIRLSSLIIFMDEVTGGHLHLNRPKKHRCSIAFNDIFANKIPVLNFRFFYRWMLILTRRVLFLRTFVWNQVWSWVILTYPHSACSMLIHLVDYFVLLDLTCHRTSTHVWHAHAGELKAGHSSDQELRSAHTP